jgi:hypothetical protein
MKPKRTQPKDKKREQVRDLFQTPDYATDLIVPYLRGVVWECAAGQGYMQRRLIHHGFDVIATDIQDGFNFLTCAQKEYFDVITTNPPFSLKEEFYKRCLSYGKPFALLIPTDVNQWILRAMMNDGAQWLIPTRRIDYITPSGKQGKESNAQFHSGWFAVGLNLPSPITIVELELGIKQGNVHLPLFAKG